jgi:surface carbohydrate biosynthesis protein
MNKRVVLLVDNKRRDLPGDALIAHNLGKLGVECFLEPLEAYKGCLAGHRPHMIIFNHLLGSHLVEYSKRLAKLGVLVGVLPNEGILYNPDVLRFNANKSHSGAHIDYFFCWNDAHKDALLENGFGNVNIEVIGPPKFDYYFKPWSNIFNIRRGTSEKKPKVLVCTNFVFSKYKELTPEHADRLFAPWKDRIPGYKDYWGLIDVNHKARTDFFGYLDRMVRSRKYNITLRPHPSEDSGPYKRWYDGLADDLRKHVVLDTDTNITELILSCDIEVSCETCTTALESWIAGKPTIELVFGRHPVFFHPEIGALNVLCDDPDKATDLIDSQLERPVQAGFTLARKEHLMKWCASPDGTASYRIAKVIADAVKNRTEPAWDALSFDERRKGIKLKIHNTSGLPYHFDYFMFIKRRLRKARYAGKYAAFQKSIRPMDVVSMMALIEKCEGLS